VTIRQLCGIQTDIQCALNHSWFVTGDGAWALKPVDGPALYQILLDPPKRFVLSLLVNGPVQSGILPNGTSGVTNQLHLCLLNDLAEVDQKTQLAFTVNNIPHAFSAYELEAALREDGNGKEPGVQALLRVLGKPPVLEPIKEGPHIGRPKGTPKGAGSGQGKRTDLGK